MKDHKQILTDSIKAHEAAISKAKSEKVINYAREQEK